MRAKFTCQSAEWSLYSRTYKLTPVISGSAENEDFFRTTPSGLITITVKKDETSASLIVGQDYYVDFTEA